MKILIDINHPAHVHYFRNFIKEMEKKGHEFKVVNRDNKMINQLLDAYGIEHVIRNKRPTKKGTMVSLLYLMGIIRRLITISLSFKPDIYIGFASSACAITSVFFRKPSILMDDTEHNVMNHKLYKPFCSVVLTPFYFEKDLGKKQIKFQAFIEQLYLHSNYYNRNEETVRQLGLTPREYVLVRYIAYDAHHDLQAHPIPENEKMNIVEQMSQEYRVIVSHEKDDIDQWYSKYKLGYPPEKMHDIEANARFVITEGATMGSEAFVLGVPFAYINPLKVGYMNYSSMNYSEVAYSGTDLRELEVAIEQFAKFNIEPERLRKKLEELTINPTAFLLWFVENYPKSLNIMRENPDYQFIFSEFTPPRSARKLKINHLRIAPIQYRQCA